jgi:4,5-dihydroxyphthalate decarboxylase
VSPETSTLETFRQEFRNSTGIPLNSENQEIAQMQLIDAPTREQHTNVLPLRIAFSDYDRTRPMVDGRVVPEGTAPAYTLDDIAQFCTRPVYEEFDVAEMSFSWYCAARDRGEPVIALPIFPLRMPVLAYMYCRADAPFQSPADLRGKKIGVLGYRLTVMLWLRGIIEDHFGVRPEEMSWVSTFATEGAGYVYPAGLDVTVAPDADLEKLLLDGTVDAVFAPTTLRGIARGDKRLRRLFPDSRAALADYYEKTNILPITHTVCVSEALIERAPWVADSMLAAFRQAQQICDESYLEPKFLSGFDQVLSLEEGRHTFGETQYVHGLKRNRHIVETFVRYAHKQNYIKTLPDIDSLFAAVSND